MPVKRPTRPSSRAQVLGLQAMTDDAVDRQLSDLTDASNRLESLRRASVTVDLVVGSNRINHNLGRKPVGANITPTVADATFAWAVASKDERQIVITVVGVAQPGATLEVY